MKMTTEDAKDIIERTSAMWNAFDRIAENGAISFKWRLWVALGILTRGVIGYHKSVWEKKASPPCTLKEMRDGSFRGMWTRSVAILSLFATISMAAPAPYPVTVNSRIQAAPGIEVYRANEKTFRVSFTDGATASDLTNCTPFMQWSTNNGAALTSPSTYSIVSSSNGVVDFTFAPASVNYAPGRYIYEVGVMVGTNVSTYQQGTFTIQGSPAGAGAANVSWTTRVDWNTIVWTNAPNFGVGTDLVARALASTSLSYAVSASALASNAQSTALSASNLSSTAVQPAALLASTVFRATESGILKSDDGLRTLVTSNGVLYLTCVEDGSGARVESYVEGLMDLYNGPSIGTSWASNYAIVDGWQYSKQGAVGITVVKDADTYALYDDTASPPTNIWHNGEAGNTDVNSIYLVPNTVTNTYAIGDSSGFVLKSSTNGWTVSAHTDLVLTNDSRAVKLTDLRFGTVLKSDTVTLSNSTPTATSSRISVRDYLEGNRMVELAVGTGNAGILRALNLTGGASQFGMFLGSDDITYSAAITPLPIGSSEARGQFANFEMRNGGSTATRLTHRILMLYGATNDVSRGNYFDIPFDYNPYSTSVTFGAWSDGNGLSPAQTNPVNVRVSGSLTVAGSGGNVLTNNGLVAVAATQALDLARGAWQTSSNVIIVSRIAGGATTNGSIVFAPTNGTVAVEISSSGNVGIKTAADSNYALRTGGNFYNSGSGQFTGNFFIGTSTNNGGSLVANGKGLRIGDYNNGGSNTDANLVVPGYLTVGGALKAGTTTLGSLTVSDLQSSSGGNWSFGAQGQLLLNTASSYLSMSAAAAGTAGAFRMPISVTSANTQYLISLTPTYNQSNSVAANTDIYINRTETLVGTGTNSFVDFRVGNSIKFRVSNKGEVYFGPSIGGKQSGLLTDGTNCWFVNVNSVTNALTAN